MSRTDQCFCERGIRLALPLAALTLAFLASCSPEPDAALDTTGSEPEPEVDRAERPKGRWGRSPARALSSEQQRAIAELDDVGYAAGSEPAPEDAAVTLHVKGRAWAGTNLYTSGHAPVAVLMDMDGRELHRWSADVREVWPEERLQGKNLLKIRFWRRAFLYENGDLLAIFEGHSLIKLDKDSHLIWRSRCRAHHDLEVLANGDILVLTREAHVVPEFDPQEPILEDFVTWLGPDGKEKRRFSLLEALDVSAFGELRRRARERREDILHTNSVSVLDGSLAARIPAFRAGNLLVSSRPLSFLAVVDPESEEVVWTLEGSFREQHDPKVLANGNLLVFDNAGRGDASSVLELDPLTGRTVWEYRGTAEAPFFTSTCGTAERLPNGNTLVTESDSGRAFEVTAEGELVWEFWSPERAGPEGEYIATLFEVVRLGPDHPLDWLEPGTGAGAAKEH